MVILPDISPIFSPNINVLLFTLVFRLHDSARKLQRKLIQACDRIRSHVPKKGDRRSAPLYPCETAGQSTERLLRLLNDLRNRNAAVSPRRRLLARNPGLRDESAAQGLHRWIRDNSQPVTTVVATRRLWIGCYYRTDRTGIRRRIRCRSRYRTRRRRRHHSHKDNSRSRSMGSRSPSPNPRPKGPSPSPTTMESQSCQ